MKKLILVFLALVLMAAPPALEVQTGKKNKNRNPPTEWVVVIDPETGIGTYKHGCCDCELWHEAIVEVIEVEGATVVKMTWTVLSVRTHMRRVLQFGKNYNRDKYDPFDQFKAENKYEER